jgi:hypothetical protein
MLSEGEWYSYHTLRQNQPLVLHTLETNENGADTGVMVWTTQRMIPVCSGNSTMDLAVV